MEYASTTCTGVLCLQPHACHSGGSNGIHAAEHRDALGTHPIHKHSCALGKSWVACPTASCWHAGSLWCQSPHCLRIRPKGCCLPPKLLWNLRRVPQRYDEHFSMYMWWACADTTAQSGVLLGVFLSLLWFWSLATTAQHGVPYLYSFSQLLKASCSKVASGSIAVSKGNLQLIAMWES